MIIQVDGVGEGIGEALAITDATGVDDGVTDPAGEGTGVELGDTEPTGEGAGVDDGRTEGVSGRSFRLPRCSFCLFF